MRPWHPLRRQRRTSREGHEPATAKARAVDALIAAWEQSSAPRVAAGLTRRVRLTIDTGGIVPGLAGTVAGRRGVADALLKIRAAHADPLLARHEVNGGPGIVIRSNGRVVGVVCVSARTVAIDELWAIVNPAKLAHWDDA